MKVKICPPAREHLISVWHDTRRYRPRADEYIAQLLSGLENTDQAPPLEYLCADLAENVAFVRYEGHIIFLRALKEDELGIVAVLRASACESMLTCGHARCQKSS